jgi:multidrug efflux pump subunit AcrB
MPPHKPRSAYRSSRKPVIGDRGHVYRPHTKGANLNFRNDYTKFIRWTPQTIALTTIGFGAIYGAMITAVAMAAGFGAAIALVAVGVCLAGAIAAMYWLASLDL